MLTVLWEIFILITVLLINKLREGEDRRGGEMERVNETRRREEEEELQRRKEEEEMMA